MNQVIFTLPICSWHVATQNSLPWETEWMPLVFWQVPIFEKTSTWPILMQLIMFCCATINLQWKHVSFPQYNTYMLCECEIDIGSGSNAFILPTNFVLWSSQKCTWLLGYEGSSPDVTTKIKLLLPTIWTTLTPPSIYRFTLKQNGSRENIENPLVVPIANASWSWLNDVWVMISSPCSWDSMFGNADLLLLSTWSDSCMELFVLSTMKQNISCFNYN